MEQSESQQHREHVEEKLRESEVRFRLLIDSIRDYAVFMLDAEGYVQTWNPGARQIKGYEASEIIGRHFSTFYSREDVDTGKCERELAIAAETGRFEEEGWRIRKDGSRFWANVVIRAIRNDEHKLIGFAKVTRDLTERRLAEGERTRLIASEQANRTKDEFLAMLSHELRNPLAPIVNALHLMRARDGGTPPRELSIIERQVQHMVRLVDDLLDVARISQGKLELKKHIMELHEVVLGAVEIVRPLIEQRQHTLSIDVAREGLGFFGDPVRMSQLFANLLNNAAKYTPPGGRIGVSAAREGADIVVRVEDSGIGISADQLARIFDPFVQAKRTTEEAAGGLGVGLTLVRSLALLHGGSVEALSEGAGRGSAFVVRLPYGGSSDGTRPTAHAQLAVASVKRHVLVVDDNADAAVLLAELLRARGHEVRVAHDGEEALRVLDGFAPDAAVLDIGLPGMDGYELARRLRERFSTACRLIAVTGYGHAEDRLRSRVAGFGTHLVKPVDPSLVLRLVEDPPNR